MQESTERVDENVAVEAVDKEPPEYRAEPVDRFPATTPEPKQDKLDPNMANDRTERLLPAVRDPKEDNTEPNEQLPELLRPPAILGPATDSPDLTTTQPREESCPPIAMAERILSELPKIADPELEKAPVKRVRPATLTDPQQAEPRIDKLLPKLTAEDTEEKLAVSKEAVLEAEIEVVLIHDLTERVDPRDTSCETESVPERTTGPFDPTDREPDTHAPCPVERVPLINVCPFSEHPPAAMTEPSADKKDPSVTPRRTDKELPSLKVPPTDRSDPSLDLPLTDTSLEKTAAASDERVEPRRTEPEAETELE